MSTFTKKNLTGSNNNELLPNADGSINVVGAENNPPSTSGEVTEVTINENTWTLIPVVANRRAIAVINNSGQEIKSNYDDVLGYVGIPILDGNERRYEHRLPFYLKSEASSCTVLIENIV